MHVASGGMEANEITAAMADTLSAVAGAAAAHSHTLRVADVAEYVTLYVQCPLKYGASGKQHYKTSLQLVFQCQQASACMTNGIYQSIHHLSIHHVKNLYQNPGLMHGRPFRFVVTAQSDAVSIS